MSETQSDPGREALKQLYNHARGLVDGGDLPPAVRMLEEVLTRARTAQIWDIAARALILLSYISDANGEYALSEQRITAALEIVEQQGLDKECAHCYVSLARVRLQRGQLGDADAALGQALMYAKRGDSSVQEANVYLFQGLCRANQGLLEDAFDYYDAACVLYRGTENEAALISTLRFLNGAAFELARDAAADAANAEAQSLLKEHNSPKQLIDRHVQAAVQRLVLGDLPAAAQQLDDAKRLIVGEPEYHQAMELELALGRYYSAVGLSGEATWHFAKAKRVAQQKQSRVRLAEIRLEHAIALIDSGDLEHALAVLIDTEIAFEHMGAQIFLARTHCAWSRYYHAAGSPEAAALALQRATAISAKLAHPGRTLAADLRRTAAALGLTSAAP